MGILKFYLGHILANCTVRSHSARVDSGALPTYKQQFRSLVGEVLMQGEDLGPPGPYIPLFYQIGFTAKTKVFDKVTCNLLF